MEEILETLKNSWQSIVAICAAIATILLQLKNIKTVGKAMYDALVATISFPRKLISTMENLSSAIDALKKSMVEVHDLAAMSNAKSLLALDDSPIGRFECSLNGDCIWTSRSLQDLFDLEEHDMLGNGWLQRLHPDDIKRVSDNWNETIKSWRPYKARYRLQYNNGSIRYVESTAAVLKNAAEKPLSIWGQVVPIEKAIFEE